jgi:hypothetical protein
MVCIDARHLHTRRQAQGVRNVRGSRTTDVFLRDYKNRSGCSQNPLGVLRNRGNLYVAKLFEAQLLERLNALWVLLWRIGAARVEQSRQQYCQCKY